MHVVESLEVRHPELYDLDVIKFYVEVGQVLVVLLEGAGDLQGLVRVLRERLDHDGLDALFDDILKLPDVLRGPLVLLGGDSD